MSGALSGVEVGAGVGPFPEHGLDEARGLAVGSGRIRPGTDVLEFQPATPLRRLGKRGRAGPKDAETGLPPGSAVALGFDTAVVTRRETPIEAGRVVHAACP